MIAIRGYALKFVKVLVASCNRFCLGLGKSTTSEQLAESKVLYVRGS